MSRGPYTGGVQPSKWGNLGLCTEPDCHMHLRLTLVVKAEAFLSSVLCLLLWGTAYYL